jgi:hypothetical protein
VVIDKVPQAHTTEQFHIHLNKGLKGMVMVERAVRNFLVIRRVYVRTDVSPSEVLIIGDVNGGHPHLAEHQAARG